MDAVEGSGEDQGVVGAEVLEAGGEGAVVDEAAGFVDYEEGEDDPGFGVGELVLGDVVWEMSDLHFGRLLPVRFFW